LFVTEDDGQTWQRHRISGDHPTHWGDHDVSIAVDEAGNVFAVWVGDEGYPWMASSRDAGHSWSRAVPLSPEGVNVTGFAVAAAGAEGRLAVAFYGAQREGGYSNDTPDQTLVQDLAGQRPDAAAWSGILWNVYLGVSLDALSDAPTFDFATLNEPSDPAGRGLCGRTRCGGVGDFIDAAIDPDGRPWVAYVDACREACTAGGEPEGEGMGVMGTLIDGPALRGVAGPLASLSS
jgi:hypothetical protein